MTLTCHDRDSDLMCHDRDSDLMCHDRDSELTCHDRDSELMCHDRYSDLTCHDRDSDLTCHDRESDLTCHDRDNDLTCHDRDSDLTCHDRDSDMTSHDRDSDMMCRDRDSDMTCHDQDSDLTYLHQQDSGDNVTALRLLCHVNPISTHSFSLHRLGLEINTILQNTINLHFIQTNIAPLCYSLLEQLVYEFGKNHQKKLVTYFIQVPDSISDLRNWEHEDINSHMPIDNYLHIQKKTNYL